MDGFILRYFLIEFVRVFHGTVLHTGGATRTLVLNDVSGFSDERYLKVPRISFYTVNFSIRQNLYVWMPADLDQFG
jgi:hypothetical protein